MCEDVILAAIRLDTVSVAASSVYTDNPNNYINVSAVPRHITTCLADMVSATGTLTDLTAVSRGTGKNATVGIIIEPSKSFESVGGEYENIMSNSETGATKALVRILIKGLRTGHDSTITRDIGLRLEYILDNANRSIDGHTYMAQRTYQDFDTSADNTILNPLCNNSGYFKMLLLRSDELSVGEWGHTFLVEFIRNFG